CPRPRGPGVVWRRRLDPILLSVAFVLGLGVRMIGLPPLVGFLAAGFILSALGFEGGALLQQIADLGVLLLLFSIGLKLKIKTLLRPEVWAGTSIHMLATVLVLAVGISVLGALGVSRFAGLDFPVALLIAFALSFSSTVFAVKVLEEKAEMPSLHGRVAIGILIMQDVIAVLFLIASTGKLPSPWAFALFGLIAVRPALMYVLGRSGHGELLPLFGLVAAIVLGAELFGLVGLKPDVGALILGVLLADHPKASELADSLLSFKDVFLVGFFLTIGLSGVPDLEAIGIALILVLIVPLKVALFFVLLTRFKLRARTSTLASLSLATYSEFGLIVGATGVSNGWIDNEWLVIIALALSVTFLLGSPINAAAHGIYARYRDRLTAFETEARHPDDQLIDPGSAEIAVFGMGQIGRGVYDYLQGRYPDQVIGIESNLTRVQEHRAAGRNVIHGDATDSDFWERLPEEAQVRLVLLAMPEHGANLYAARRLAAGHYPGFVAALAQFPDEIETLKKVGVNAAFNFYGEAGAGFAEHVVELAAAEGVQEFSAAPTTRPDNQETT
ncbi:MAG: cation:proton antiporter, partial [Alphaproteobacteria bacterium]